MSAWPRYEAATGCRNAGPGATNMLWWLDRESPVADIGYNLGVCNCRTVRGKDVPSCHGECRAWDLGLPMVNGRGNPRGHWLIQHVLIPNAVRLGIQCLIFDRVIWSAKSPTGTRYRGLVPHYDHIHGEHTRDAAKRLNVPTIRAVTAGKVPPAIIVPGDPEPEPEPELPPPPELEDVMPNIVQVTLPNHRWSNTTWEFREDGTRRMVPRAGGRADNIRMAALGWGSKVLTLSPQMDRKAALDLMAVLWERYPDSTPPGDYDADGYREEGQRRRVELARDQTAEDQALAAQLRRVGLLQ